MNTTKKKPLLNADGTPNAGYATHEFLHYNKDAIKAMPWRIKEWDFYQVEDIAGRYCLQLTYGHAAYVGQVGVMFFDIKEHHFIVNESKLIPLAFDSMKLPRTAEGDSEIRYLDKKKGIKVHFRTKDGVRDLLFTFGDFSCSLRLSPGIPDALCIAVPFLEKPTQFYYNYKRNGMACTGEVHYKDGGESKTLLFGEDSPEKLPALGILDWGRGVWPFSNEWFWSNGAGYIDGELFGFNLGCGFGDTSKATENILFYRGKAHKLGQVRILHEPDYLAPWMLKDEEGRLNLTMEPEHDRITRDKVLFVDNCTHQVFGRFYGQAVLDDGSTVAIEGLPAFAEHAINNW
ncbi:MAG: DUF2804 domain-containing protein [Lachnospiraceae bacterium]|nr:DUF2804 domain-containing protein [Lachnospiraceae bacterium]